MFQNIHTEYRRINSHMSVIGVYHRILSFDIHNPDDLPLR